MPSGEFSGMIDVDTFIDCPSLIYCFLAYKVVLICCHLEFGVFFLAAVRHSEEVRFAF